MGTIEKANEQIHRKRAADKTDKVGEIAPRVAAVSALSLKSDVPPDVPCGWCGKPAKRRLCSECRMTGREWISQAKGQKRRIEEIIPVRFKKARLCLLSASFKATVKTLPPETGLLLWGLAGVGKSWAMAAIARSKIWRMYSVGRVSYEMLCLEIRDTFKQTASKTELQILKKYLQPQYLFIEDVGTTKSIGEQESDFSRRTFLVLLDQRLEQCKPTFITSNKNVEDLAKSFDARIASRIQQACTVIELRGKDRRKETQ